jgi:hypothetical protein
MSDHKYRKYAVNISAYRRIIIYIESKATGSLQLQNSEQSQIFSKKKTSSPVQLVLIFLQKSLKHLE